MISYKGPRPITIRSWTVAITPPCTPAAVATYSPRTGWCQNGYSRRALRKLLPGVHSESYSRELIALETCTPRATPGRALRELLPVSRGSPVVLPRFSRKAPRENHGRQLRELLPVLPWFSHSLLGLALLGLALLPLLREFTAAQRNHLGDGRDKVLGFLETKTPGPA